MQSYGYLPAPCCAIGSQPTRVSGTHVNLHKVLIDDYRVLRLVVLRCVGPCAQLALAGITPAGKGERSGSEKQIHFTSSGWDRLCEWNTYQQ